MSNVTQPNRAARRHPERGEQSPSGPVMPDDADAAIQPNRAARRAAARATRRHPEQSPSPPDMSIPDTAKYLRVNEGTVRVMIADGRLKAYKLGDRVIRLRRSEIDAAMEAIGGDVA